MIEVIVTTLTEAKTAERFGANRLELIADLPAGGTTPSFGTIRNVLEQATIPVHVMIRPHANSFVYNEEDVETILADVGLCRELGAEGIVFGALTNDGRIDEALLGEVIKHKGEMALTFHRAIDDAVDLMDAITILNDFPEVDHVLTSGGKATALDGIERLSAMQEVAEMNVLPGAGITADNVAQLIERLGVDFVHVGSGVRTDGQLDEQKFNAIKRQMTR
ncbi:copper homeostasis protein CutC [Exiguobacterium sp. SL-10]|jgi:copper homeostasis protein|uniref:copper homeostasis protein CutC n=1 Tax=Exiguobacterium sp. SL-10 TaxID=2510962 RepID=UPI00103F1987|nr:copper homeostasis protein CutC [Exiguobacterium sp. SL-10]TCI30777.1 copper homeostasis protein CutC [Exiguobacterium sp. SL-10]